MLKCPNCDATLDQDFGMVTCTECKSVLMIDLSGQVQISDGSEVQYDDSDDFATAVEDDATDPPEESFTAADDFESVQTLGEDFDDDADFDPMASDGDEVDSDDGSFEESAQFEDAEQYEDDQDYTDETSYDASAEEDDDIQAMPGGFETSVDEPEEFTDETGEEDFVEAVDDVADDPVEGEAYAAQAGEESEELESFPMASEPDPDPVDITDYANSEASNLEDGEFLYDVTISRLDSKDLREALKYVLIDEKLKLNHHEYLKKIKDGKVVIEDLNPLKAKRIVEQLQYYSVTISWRQKRVVMEMVEPEADDGETGDLQEVPSEDINA